MSEKPISPLLQRMTEDTPAAVVFVPSKLWIIQAAFSGQRVLFCCDHQCSDTAPAVFLLRSHDKWPSRRRTAEKRNELASLHASPLRPWTHIHALQQTSRHQNHSITSSALC
jgi:hypothetical protein